MVKNEELADAVFKAMHETLFVTDESWGIVCEGDEEFGIKVLKSHAQTKVDLPEKLRIHVMRMIGYGYDFSKNESVKDTYQAALENTNKEIAGEFGGTLLANGIVEDKIGWYITKL